MRARQPSRRLRGLAFGALLLAALRVDPVPAAEPSTLKVGISEAVNTVLAIWMADAAGLYEAEGLKVEIINMNGGSRGAAELAAGRIDAMHVGLSSVVRLNKSGGDLRVVASLANVIRFTFFSAPGVTQRGAAQGRRRRREHLRLGERCHRRRLRWQRLGLTRDDVTLKEYGGGGRRLAALKTGEIKATAVNEPSLQPRARAGFARAGRPGAGAEFRGCSPRSWSGKKRSRNRRDALTRFVRATAEGNALALADERRAKEVLARAGRDRRPENPRYQLQRFPRAVAAGHRRRPRPPPRTSSSSFPTRAATRPTIST